MPHLFLRSRSLAILFTVIAVFPATQCSTPEDDDPDVTANEELYINEVYASGDDWIELYNNTNSTKDISGYRIYDDPVNKYVIPNGISVPAKGFLVFLCNDLATGLNTSFKLTSTGETVFLENKAGNVIDKVAFPSLQNRQAYGRFPDGSTSLAITGLPTEGETNGGSSALSITDVSRTPIVPDQNDAVTVRVELFSAAGISAVKLYYRFNNADFSTVNMTAGAGVYTGTIPAANALGRMDYYIEAINNDDISSFSPASAPSKTHSYLLNTDVLPKLVINEFMGLNASCCPDQSSGIDEFDDWIEIYNAGATSVNLANMYLSDDPANPFNSKIAATNSSATTLDPGEYLVIWADGQRDQGELHVDFRLSQDGEAVGLYYIDGRKIDETSFGILQENKSIGRQPNGTGAFQTLSSPSPGEAND